MKLVSNAGFTMVELAIVILIFGAVAAFGVPTLAGFNERNQLKAATLQVSAQLRLTRENAIATGSAQTMHFSAGFAGGDYHIHNGSVTEPKWSLPKKVTYYWGSGTEWQYQMRKDGRCYDPVTNTPLSGLVILQDSRGFRDTISVQASGLVLVK